MKHIDTAGCVSKEIIRPATDVLRLLEVAQQTAINMHNRHTGEEVQHSDVFWRVTEEDHADLNHGATGCLYYEGVYGGDAA